MLVKDGMTRRAETIGPDETLEAAARKMRAVGVGVLVVCEEGRLVGMITDRDIVVRSSAAGRNPTVSDVRSAMTPQVVHCSDEADFMEAAMLMARRAVRRVAVFDSGERLVGVLSVDDIALVDRTLAGEVIEHSREPDRPTRPGVPLWE